MAVARGCGSRIAGGLYLETLLGPSGRPVTDFLMDPVRPLPTGFRPPAIGVSFVEHPRTGVVNVLDWIGAEHYPNVADLVEEVRRFGLSRRISTSAPIGRLTPESRVLLVHGRAYVANWEEYLPVEKGCPKGVHDRPLPTGDDRFWSKVVWSQDHWLWGGADNGSGYGQFWLNGKMVYAHRYAYETEKGPLGDGQEACHSCDVPNCVRPDHLFAGSHAQNMADAASKGRSRSAAGESNPNSKLTDAQVEEIRRLRRSGESLLALARAFGVHHSTISRIANEQVHTNRADPDPVSRPHCNSIWWDDVDGGEPTGLPEGAPAEAAEHVARMSTFARQLIASAYEAQGADFGRDVLRSMPSFRYRARRRPQGVKPAYQAAIFAAFPISQLTVITDPVGKTHERALRAAEKAGIWFPVVQEDE